MADGHRGHPGGDRTGAKWPGKISGIVSGWCPGEGSRHPRSFKRFRRGAGE